MDDLRRALEIELDRLKLLVQKYTSEDHSPKYWNKCAAHSCMDSHCHLQPRVDQREHRPLYEHWMHCRCCVDRCHTSHAHGNTYNAGFVPLVQQNNSHYDSTLNSQKYAESDDVIERRKFMEAFLRLQYVDVLYLNLSFSEFYRHSYPFDSEVVIELRALRAAYEHTGGSNTALLKSLDNTLDEAVRVDSNQHVGTMAPSFDPSYNYSRYIPPYSGGEYPRWTPSREFERKRTEMDRLFDPQSERIRRF
ncbi:hypothetical protein PHET_07384 [Paragonimus heterotremus]|uniref:Uncharacterized protein n=1 Tax=Paragonimus heterotremus TaxID=100268 RepID=A0A8J4T6L0_9TREM|nr:hypothetical protein PHET_07384 [Paragonimus heterotremus]